MKKKIESVESQRRALGPAIPRAAVWNEPIQRKAPKASRDEPPRTVDRTVRILNELDSR
jgi:hypothetical protein